MNNTKYPYKIQIPEVLQLILNMEKDVGLKLIRFESDEHDGLVGTFKWL